MCTDISPKIPKLHKMSSVTAAIDGKYTCQLCEYQTLKKPHLKRHEQSVHDGKHVQCSECEYQTTNKSRLGSHKKSLHMGWKFNCPDCDHQLSSKGNLV